MGTESGIRNMTAGSPFRHILMFTLPLLAGNFLQQFYNMVDSWVVELLPMPPKMPALRL